MKTAHEILIELDDASPVPLGNSLIPILERALLDARLQGYTESAEIMGAQRAEDEDGYSTYLRLKIAILTARDQLKQP